MEKKWTRLRIMRISQQSSTSSMGTLKAMKFPFDIYISSVYTKLDVQNLFKRGTKDEGPCNYHSPSRGGDEQIQNTGVCRYSVHMK